MSQYTYKLQEEEEDVEEPEIVDLDEEEDVEEPEVETEETEDTGDSDW